jgi:hypothetical protein
VIADKVPKVLILLLNSFVRGSRRVIAFSGNPTRKEVMKEELNFANDTGVEPIISPEEKKYLIKEVVMTNPVCGHTV